MESVIAAASTLAFGVGVTMLTVGVSALVLRFAVRSVSGRAVAIYWRITDSLFIAYLFFTGQFLLLLFWVPGMTLPKTRQSRHPGKNALIAQACGLFLLGTMAVLDKMRIVYLRAAVLIPAAFLFLIAFVWAAIVESKKEYPVQSTHTFLENDS
jgi:hypothetical protein